MLNFRILMLLILLSGVITYIVEHFGFAIAHSTTLLCLAVIIAPGILIAFLDWNLADNIALITAIIVNIAYYCFVYIVTRWVIKRKHLP